MRLGIVILVLVGALWQPAEARDKPAVCQCLGATGPGTGPGGPCYDAPGGRAYSGPGGPAYRGPGGPCADSASSDVERQKDRRSPTTPTYEEYEERRTYFDPTRSPYTPPRPGDYYVGNPTRCGTLYCFQR
jgi:hypothetical protein